VLPSRNRRPDGLISVIGAQCVERGLDPETDDLCEALIANAGIPAELVGRDTTVEEIGELAIYVAQLKTIGRRLRMVKKFTPLDIPITALPAYVLERRLAARQQQAQHVSGSDLGDGHLASLVLYADAVQVDKRTHNYLKQVKREDPAIGSLMCPFFKEGDYSKIPSRF